MHITYITKDVMREFSNESFPAWDIRDMVAVIFLSVRHTRGRRSWTIGHVIPRRSPRYVNRIFPMTHPKVFAMHWRNSRGVLMGIIANL